MKKGRGRVLVRERIFKVISRSDGDKLSRIFDIGIMVLIILNTFAVIIATFDIKNAAFLAFLSGFEAVSVAIFTIEYLLRLATSDFLYPSKSKPLAALRYVFSIQSIIDVLAIAPFYLPMLISIDLRVLRLLRLLRLFRIMKINRYTESLNSIGRVIKRKSSQLLSSIFVVALLILVSAVIMFNVENAAQPEAFDNIFSAFWWAIATLTTVGYGDIYPITALGKVLSSIIALLGIGLVALPTGIISSGFMEVVEEKTEEPEPEPKHFCPYCGKKID